MYGPLYDKDHYRTYIDELEHMLFLNKDTRYIVNGKCVGHYLPYAKIREKSIQLKLKMSRLTLVDQEIAPGKPKVARYAYGHVQVTAIFYPTYATLTLGEIQ